MSNRCGSDLWALTPTTHFLVCALVVVNREVTAHVRSLLWEFQVPLGRWDPYQSNIYGISCEDGNTPLIHFPQRSDDKLITDCLSDC